MTERFADIIGLIRKEVKPALGCTEPIAVALAVAKAVEIIEDRCSYGADRGDWRMAADMDVKVAVASGLGNARELLKKVQAGEADYHFIEIMGCPGGCVNGGGQPQQPGYVRNTVDIRAKRAEVLYNIDKNNPIRKSHENPAIIELYDTYLGEPGSHKAHELLHTTYVKRVVNRDL